MSNENKHTPGPWKANEFGGIVYINASFKNYSHCIATVHDLCDGKNNDELKAHKPANINIIAAAPDMYEALKVAREMISALTPDFVSHGLTLIEQAIAKAEGK